MSSLRFPVRTIAAFVLLAASTAAQAAGPATRDVAAEEANRQLVLTFYEDRPAAAVASELGLTAGNVRVIRHRGLQRLRACLEGAEGRA